LLNEILTEKKVNFFLSRIEKNFPNFIAGVITDRHGFILGTKIPLNFHIKENIMALSAITNRKNFFNNSEFLRVKRNLDKSKNFKLFILLNKSNNELSRFKSLKSIIEEQELF